MEAVAIDYQVLAPLFRQVYALAATLVVRLDTEEDLHIAEVRNSIVRLMNELQAEADRLEAGDAFAEVQPLLQGLLQDVVRNSSWDHITRCTYCKWEVRDMIMPPGLLLEQAEDVRTAQTRGESVRDKAELMLHVLALAKREPYFLERWRALQKDMLRLAQPELRAEDFPEAPISPDLGQPWRLNAIDLHLPEEPPQNPLGRVGAAWRTMEAFCERYKINPAQQSWFLLLGQRASGKTALLRTPEADFAAIEETPSEGPGANVCWFYKSDGHMVLDVPGRMVADDAEASDRAQYLHLLDLLRSHRRDKPINGIVLAVPLEQVLESETAAQKLGAQLRGLLQLTARKLSMRPPVYVVFTQCDQLFGLAEFAMALSPTRRRELFGITPDGELGDPFSKEDFRERFWRQIQHVQKLVPHLLAQSPSPRDAAGVIGMPIELGAQSQALGEFLETLMLSLGDKPLYLYRGAYFTAARPGGHQTLRELAFVPPSERLAKPLMGGVTGVSLFTGDLFGERIFAERNVFLPRFEVGLDELESDRSYTSSIKWPWKSVLRIAGAAVLLVLLIWFVHAVWTLTEARHQRIVVAGVPFQFTLVPGSKFAMGSPGSDPLRFPDEHQHLVEVPHFYAGTFEVTQRQWRAVMNNNPSFYDCGVDCPVHNLSYEDALAFVDQLNQQHGTAEPLGHFALLPEAQWEYAARGGSAAQFPGVATPGTSAVEPPEAALQAWYIMNPTAPQLRQPQAVGLLRPNHYGLYDMGGNIAEWVADVYRAYPGGRVEDLLTQAPDQHILRGGSFFLEYRNIRPASRGPFPADYHDRDSGLRLQWVPAPETLPGKYLGERAWMTRAYFATSDWLAANRDWLLKNAGDFGAWLGKAWDSLTAPAPAPTKDAAPAAAAPAPAAK